nr:DUF6036 family nucleotidyltransferase [Bordetella sp. LUAb4]
MRDLLMQLQDRLQLERMIKAYIAGGIAVHLYTAYRVTVDVDMEFDAKVPVPSDLSVELPGESGRDPWLYIDTQYNSTFSLIHEDHREDAWRVPLGLSSIDVYVLSPVDLAVSKISRFAENDREDIATLVRQGLTTADAIETRANEALSCYVGNVDMLKTSIRLAVELAKKIEAQFLA